MAITMQRDGSRVYLVGDTYAAKDRIKAIGGHWDGDRRAWWVGAAKADEAARLVESLSGAGAAPAGERTPQDPADIRLTGKGEYKGRTYYLGSRTRDGAKVRCLTLPDAAGKYLDFWTAAELVRVVKTYQPREYRGRQEHTTLGGIARFVSRARREDAQIARGEVPAGYCVDLEDGMLKRRGECDMPSD